VGTGASCRLVSFAALVRRVEALGFREAGGRESHRVFVHPKVTELINPDLQTEQGHAKRYHVSQMAQSILRDDLLLKEEP